jgi:hypothetical protein
MTIGIFTIHTGYNEGATLQALALALLIEEVTGEPAEIVDHRHTTQTEAHYGPPSDGRRRAIAAFRQSVLPLSSVNFVEDPRAAWTYARAHYSAVVVGSDEIWKIAYRSRFKGLVQVQNDPLAPAFPNAYWPDASAGARRVAYAATAGTKTNWKRIPFFRKWQIANRLKGFTAVGLRDERTRAFLGAVAPEAAGRSVRVPDPTLGYDLLPFARDGIRETLEGLGVDFTRPRVVVTAGHNPKIAALIPELAAQGFQTVALSYPTKGVELDLSQAALSPLEWGAAFGCFDLSISDRMHGCLFSLRNLTPLILLDARAPTMGYPTKNGEIATRFGVEEFYFPLAHSRTSPASLLEAALRAVNGGWPREAVAARLAAEREIALGFIGDALGRRSAA